jgi:hypothetical protein
MGGWVRKGAGGMAKLACLALLQSGLAGAEGRQGGEERGGWSDVLHYCGRGGLQAVYEGPCT